MAMVALLRKKSLLFALAALLGAAMLIWIPIIGRYSLDDPQPMPVQPASINEDPKPFLGRRVQVEGEVERIYGPRAFTLDQETAAGSAGAGGALLVVGKKPWTLLQKNPQVNELVRNDHVQVTGRVRKFRLREFRKEIGEHPSDSLLSRWEGRPALIALDIELTPGVPDLFPEGTAIPRQSGLGGSGGPSPDPSPDSLGQPAFDSVFGNP